jgi:hypothetical protein
VVSLDVIVGVLIGAMPRRREQLAERGRVGRRLVGDDLHGRDLGCGDGPLEEVAGGPGVAPRGDEHVDDLAELVDRTVDIAPAAGHLDVGLVHEPTIPDQVAAGSGGVGQQRREPLHPPIDGDVVDLNAALDEELLDVAVGQAEPQVPAHREDDYLGWKPEASEGGPLDRGRARATGFHAGSVSART